MLFVSADCENPRSQMQSQLQRGRSNHYTPRESMEHQDSNFSSFKRTSYLENNEQEMSPRNYEPAEKYFESNQHRLATVNGDSNYLSNDSMQTNTNNRKL